MVSKKKSKNQRGSGSQAVPEEVPVVVPQAAPPEIAPQGIGEEEWSGIEDGMRDLLVGGKKHALKFLDSFTDDMRAKNPIPYADLARLHELYCELNSGNTQVAIYNALTALNFYGFQFSSLKYMNTYLVLISYHMKRTNGEGLSKASELCRYGLEKFGQHPQLQQKEIELKKQIEDARIAMEKYDELLAEAEEEEAAAAAAQKKGKGKMEIEESDIPARYEASDVQEDNALEAVAQEEREKNRMTADASGPLEFDARYKMVIDRDNCKGYMCYDKVKVATRLLQVDSDDLSNFDEYRQLCSSDEGLLTVLHMVGHPDNDDDKLMVVDDVMTFAEYLQLLKDEFSHMADQSESAWWRLIANRFRILFGGVAEILIFLYGKQRRPCGNLLKLYVTKQGKPRIQPCPETTNMQDDVNMFLVLMKQMLHGPFHSQDINEDVFNFPLELKHLLTFIPKYKGILPAKGVLNHPFFWTISVKTEYPGKLSKALRNSGLVLTGLNQELEGFADWEKRLPHGGLYQAIWKVGDPNKVVPNNIVQAKVQQYGYIEVAKYKDNKSIIRYFSNAVEHVNENRFQKLRSQDTYSDEKILADLTNLYPNFYTRVYEAVAHLIIERSWAACDELLGLQTKDSDFPEL